MLYEVFIVSNSLKDNRCIDMQVRLLMIQGFSGTTRCTLSSGKNQVRIKAARESCKGKTIWSDWLITTNDYINLCTYQFNNNRYNDLNDIPKEFIIVNSFLHIRTYMRGKSNYYSRLNSARIEKIGWNGFRIFLEISRGTINGASIRILKPSRTAHRLESLCGKKGPSVR